MDLRQKVSLIKNHKPLILNLTNTVVQNFTANVLLALGASPVMSNDTEDALALGCFAEALNINIGTLDVSFMDRALACAKANSKPMVLDPVGAGATAVRTNAASLLLPYASILRGNAGEILALQGTLNQTKGVDSLAQTSAIDQDKLISKFPQLVIAASGVEDVIYYTSQKSSLPFGVEMMTQITGMGCALSAVCAAFAAIEKDMFSAAVSACAFYALCGELAYQKAQTPGAFASAFLDTLHTPDWDYISSRLKSLS